MRTIAEYRANKDKFTRIQSDFADSLPEVLLKMPEDGFLLMVSIDPMDVSRYVFSYYI